MWEGNLIIFHSQYSFYSLNAQGSGGLSNFSIVMFSDVESHITADISSHLVKSATLFFFQSRNLNYSNIMY